METAKVKVCKIVSVMWSLFDGVIENSLIIISHLVSKLFEIINGSLAVNSKNREISLAVSLHDL